MRTVSMTQLKNQIGDVTAIAQQDNGVIVERNNKPFMVLVPYDNFHLQRDHKKAERLTQALDKAARISQRTTDLKGATEMIIQQRQEQ